MSESTGDSTTRSVGAPDLGQPPRRAPSWATRRDWSLDDVLPESLLDCADGEPSADEAHEPRVFQDLAAEYDARLLEVELMRREATLSEPFKAFLEAWAADEAKHTTALHRIHRGAFGGDVETLDERLSVRQGDFGPLEDFLADEFKLGVMLAYDEAMSAHGYGGDIPFYSSLGRNEAQRSAYARLLNELKNDEATHCRNAIELLALRHTGRAADVAGVMEEIVAHDTAQKEYRATFLLDHASDSFDSDMMRRIGRSVMHTLERRL